MIQAGELLRTIHSPEDLKKLDQTQLFQLTDELRQFIVDNVSVYGGHFAASLGVVELTVALHYVFNTPTDQLVWDVGHQAYGHKILTGRMEQFHTNRMYKGLSGFPKRAESEYDTFGVGHSSTSISAALGMAVANQYQKDNRQHIAVIGDGALTGGMAFEAMNHAGVSNSNLLIVLNDNCMAIDPNVGALKDYLVDITTSRTYNKMRDDLWKILGKISKFGPNAQAIASKVESGLKASLLKQSNLFESLHIRYFGPVDGHDLNHMVQVMNDLKGIPGPKILHVLTTKGKGFALAEKDQVKWHAPGKFDKVSGQIHVKTYDTPQAPKYQDVFGHTIIELAEANPKIMGITPAMPSGSSLNLMMEKMPDRAFDVGIAEQHAVTFSAGMATQGLVPFCNIYSTFMQRAYDQVIHDVCIQNLHVIFCLDRAGVAGVDGPTHHGAYDLAYFRCVPNLVVAAPMNEQELRNMMYTAQLDKNNGPFSIRYPRGQGVMPNWKTPFEELQIGKGRKVSDGEEVAILTIGHIGNYAVEAKVLLKEEELTPAHYDMRFVKPLDEALLHDIFKKYKKVITVEDGCLMGGFGSAVLEFMADNRHTSTFALHNNFTLWLWKNFNPDEGAITDQDSGLENSATAKIASCFGSTPVTGGGIFLPYFGGAVTIERTINLRCNLADWHGGPYTRLSLSLQCHKMTTSGSAVTWTKAWIIIEPSACCVGPGSGYHGCGMNPFLGDDPENNFYQWWGGGPEPGYFDADGNWV